VRFMFVTNKHVINFLWRDTRNRLGKNSE